MYIYTQLDIEIERKSERERERETELGDHEIHNTVEAILDSFSGKQCS